MESLQDKQWRFVKLICKLVAKADELGYELTYGDAYREHDGEQNWRHATLPGVTLRIARRPRRESSKRSISRQPRPKPAVYAAGTRSAAQSITGGSPP